MGIEEREKGVARGWDPWEAEKIRKGKVSGVLVPLEHVAQDEGDLKQQKISRMKRRVFQNC